MNCGRHPLLALVEETLYSMDWSSSIGGNNFYSLKYQRMQSGYRSSDDTARKETDVEEQFCNQLVDCETALCREELFASAL